MHLDVRKMEGVNILSSSYSDPRITEKKSLYCVIHSVEEEQ